MKRILLIAITLVLMTITLSFAAETEQSGFSADPRLDQKVAITAHGELLYKVVEDLVQQTKIDIRCGASPDDWQVRDRKLILIIKDMPLKDLQTKLAELLHFTWRQFEKDGKYSYRIYQSAAQKKEEADLRAKIQTAFATKARTALAEFDKLDSMSDADIEKLKTTSPWLYVMAKEKAGTAMRQLLKIPAVRDAIQNQERLEIPVSELRPEDQAAAKSLAKGLIDLMKRVAPADAGLSDMDSSASADEDGAKLVISGGKGEYDPSGTLGTIEVTYGGMPFPVADPSSRTMKRLGEMVVNGRILDDAAAHEMIDIDKEEQKASKRKITIPDDPIFDEKINAKDRESGTVFGAFDLIAEKSKLQVISDYFPNFDAGFDTAATTLRALVLQVLTDLDKQVTKDDKDLVFQDYEWFVKRSWAVPEKKLELWRSKTKAKKLTLADLVEISKLTDDQIDHTIIEDDTLGVLDTRDGDTRNFLRFYGSLSPDAQQEVMSETGLPVSSLTESQQKAMVKAVPSYQRYDDVSADAQVLSCKISGNGFLYSFDLKPMVSSSSEDQNIDGDSHSDVESFPVGWAITLPGMVEEEDNAATE